ALLGLFWLATVPLTSGIVAQVFGTRHFSMLFGVIFMSHQIGGFCGAWLGGVIYDVTGSYDLMWGISVALALIAAALHWPISDRPLERLSEPAGVT
ncbi:MAG: MFS transporter, partial [Alphaproteobacteria bacterium]|nr:MFS transporter [Alphaproteobacteria bacterium]